VNPLATVKAGWDLNQRDHRKLLIIDGRSAFLGGINISSVYSGGSFSQRSKVRPGGELPWRDTHIQLMGPVVGKVHKLLMATWEKQAGKPLSERNYCPPATVEGSAVVRAMGSSPDEDYSLIYAKLISALRSAETDIWITNAYFVPDPQLLDALKEAVGRGVDVQLVVPSSTDSWLVFHAGRSHYKKLLKAGVKLYERREALLDAKTAVIDGVWPTVGSTNLDWRSFLHNQEVNVVALGDGFGDRMRANLGILALIRAAGWAFVLSLSLATALPAHAQDAAALTARYAALRGQLASDQYPRPLYLESTASRDALRGDVYALLNQRFALVASALQDRGKWCDILILHLNVKGCRPANSSAGKALRVNVGRKFDQPLDDTYLFDFLYAVEVDPGYLRVALSAGEGPLGTSDYRIIVEVVALDAGLSFLHLSYSYVDKLPARMAMRSYLATIGRDKVGFSIVGRKPDGQPVYINGVRGVVERNTMRYFLALEAYLGALSAPDAAQMEIRLDTWFTAAERYRAQLHEMERADYLDMKRKEVRRQQAPGPSE